MAADSLEGLLAHGTIKDGITGDKRLDRHIAGCYVCDDVKDFSRHDFMHNLAKSLLPTSQATHSRRNSGARLQAARTAIDRRKLVPHYPLQYNAKHLPTKSNSMNESSK